MINHGQCIMRLQSMSEHLHSSILDIGLTAVFVDMMIMVIVVFVGMMVAIMVVIVGFVAMAAVAATGRQLCFAFNLTWIHHATIQMHLRARQLVPIARITQLHKPNSVIRRITSLRCPAQVGPVAYFVEEAAKLLNFLHAAGLAVAAPLRGRGWHSLRTGSRYERRTDARLQNTLRSCGVVI
ncbi:MAG: hypothetical protein HHJ12_11705 [Glaciimonas sp.]|nr:hypothetical protein [Glaciimonas sp.]